MLLMKINTESQKRTKSYPIANPFTPFKTYCQTQKLILFSKLTEGRMHHVEITYEGSAHK